MTVNEFFGTLQQSVTDQWRKHLQTNKYSKHMALNEYYEKMPELVDALVEAYQSEHDVVKDYVCLIDAKEHDALSYLRELKKLVKQGRKELFEGESEMESMIDNILELIDGTIYKLDKLTESVQSLKDYLTESLQDINFVGAKLQKRLDDLGLGDIQLKKGPKGFYLDSANKSWKKVLVHSEFNTIPVKSYNDKDEDWWVETIENIVKTLN